MKRITAVFNSSLVNRYGMIMPITGLEANMNQTWDTPIPSSIGHDIHRATGYSSAIALHLQPGFAKLFGQTCFATSSEDMNSVRSVVGHTLTRLEAGLNQEKLAELKERLGANLSDHGRINAQGCAAYCDQGLASRVFPELFAKRDKDGLISVSELSSAAPGIYKKDGLLLFAHSFFRRSLSRYNSLNTPFLRRLGDVATDASLDVRIALDEDLLGHPDTLFETIELEYWWGPHFSDKLEDIRIGVTRHQAGDSARFFHAISAAEFWWYEQDELKTFECEELRDLDVPSMGKSNSEFGCRFVHSILDRTTHLPYHLDGAVRLYDEDLMLERVDKDIMHFGRRAVYTKLWRVDGQISFQSWKALINDYYRDNHLVGEYFGGKEDDEESIRPQIVQIDDGGSIHNFAPCTMTVGDGIRIAISYHPRSVNTATRWIEPIERFDSGEGWRDYMESCGVEIIKLIKRRGDSIDVSDNIAIIAFDDMVTNLPLIEHCGVNSINDAQITLDVVRKYCEALQKRGDDRMLAFHISIRFPDRDVHFSFAGHVCDMSLLLKSDFAKLPGGVEEIGEWAEAVAEWMLSAYPDARDVPPMVNMIKTAGLLTIDRKFLESGEFEVEASVEAGVAIKLVECPSITAALPVITKHKLVVSMATIIKSSKCSKCDGSYRDCNCIKLVDEGVTQTITGFELFGFFWTDRSAWSTSPTISATDS